MGGAVGGVAGLGWVLRLGEGARRLARVRHPSSNGLGSVDIYVIPSAERNPETLRYGCHIRFFTPLRYVQNDMTGSR